MSTNDTQSTPVVQRPVLDKYEGNKSVIRADLWLNLYEVICRTQSEANKIQGLVSYLSDDALNWFASDICPNLPNLTWDEVRKQFVLRFGSQLEDPLTVAQKRYLRPNETVQQYF